MRIGSGVIDTARGRVATTGAKKTGPAGTIPKDRTLAALDDYEDYQRQAFEAQWFHEPADWLHTQLATVRTETAPPGSLRERRIRAEIWAIERILNGRRNPN